VLWWLTTITTQTDSPIQVTVVDSIDSALEKDNGSEPQENPSMPFVIGVHPTHFFSVGMTGGGTVSSTNGGYIGIESSMSRVHGNRLLGLSADVVWDSALNGASMTIGPKVGLLMLAMDGGLGVRSDFDFTESVELGMYGRVGLNLGLGGLYYRMGWWPESDELSVMHHVGVSIKIPQQLGYKPRTPYNQRRTGG